MEEGNFVTPKKKTTRKTSKPISQSSQPSPATTTTPQFTKPISNYFQPKNVTTLSGTPSNGGNSLKLSYKDDTAYEIAMPKSLEALHDLVSSKFNLPESDMEIRNLRGQSITETEFEKLANNEVLVIVDKRDAQFHKQDFFVDITPSKNILLKAGTAEYDVPSAIGELIDNSIQAVRNNEDGNRMIQIRLNHDGTKEKRVKILYIWDNGVGMDATELRDWATMGVSQSDGRDKLTLDGTSHSDRGYISRFGVGAKRAAFYLGKKIEISTRKSEGVWVSTLTLSTETLSQHEDSWKVQLSLREPKSKQLNHPHFTLIKITDLNFSFEGYGKEREEDFDKGVDYLRKTLGHMYYYYIFPKDKPNFKNTEEEEENEEQEVEEEEEKGKKKGKASQKNKSQTKADEEFEPTIDPEDGSEDLEGVYDLKVQGKHLRKEPDDLESQYLRYGKNLQETKIKMTDDSGRRTTALLRVLYFPFEMGTETLPVPLEFLLDKAKEKESKEIASSAKKSKKSKVEELVIEEGSVPLLARKPGVEIFWNERLIKEASLPLMKAFGFCKKGGSVTTNTGQVIKLEDTWFSRVKAMLFVNSAYPVTHNKMHICSEDPVWKRLEANNDRKLTKWFKEWLYDSHNKFDQDIIYKGAKYDSQEGITKFDSVSIGKHEVKTGDFIKFKLKGNAIRPGLLKQLYFHGTEEMKGSDKLAIITVTGPNGETSDEKVPISKIMGRLSDSEFKKMEKENKQKLPSALKIFQGEGVDLPPQELVAGEALKWVSVTILDGQKAPTQIKKWDKNEKVTLHVLLNKIVVFECTSSTMYKPGRMSFKNVNCFTKSGTYTLSFFSTIPTIKAVTHTIEVKPADIHSYSMSVEDEQELFHSGTPIPRIIIEGRDKYDNPVPIEDTQGLEFEATPKDDKSTILPITDSPHFDHMDGTFVITNLVITCRTPGLLTPSGIEVEISVMINGVRISTDIKLATGLPAFLEIEDDPFTIDAEFEAKSTTKPFQVTLKDAIGDVASTTFIYNVEVESDAFKKPVRVKVYDGLAEFTKGLQFDYKGSENTVTLTFKLMRGKNKREEALVFKVERNINISPSKDPVSIRLIPNDEDTIDQESPLILRGEAGSQRKWKINILSATKQIVTGLNGTLSVSWREDDTDIEDSEEEIPLPLLTLPQQAKGQTYTINWKYSGGAKKKSKIIQLKFSVNISPLPPYSLNLRFDDVSPEVQKVKCDTEYILKIYLRDAYENQIGDPSPEDKKWLQKLTPQFSITADESSATNVSDDVFKWTPENYWVASVRIHSRTLGAATFTVVDPTNKLKSSSIPVYISEGQVTQLRINGLDGVTVNGYKGYSMEEYTITTCDACGNLVKMNASLDFKAKNCKKPPMSVKKLGLQDGSCNLGAVLIDGGPGEYDIQVSCLSFKLTSCKIALKIVSDPGEPSKIKILKCPDSVQVKQNFTVTAQLLSDDDESIDQVTPKSVNCYLDNLPYVTSYIDKDKVFYFEDVQAPTKSGTYTLSIKFQSSSVIEETVQLEVLPSDPVKLQIPEPITDAQFVNGQTLFDKLEVHLTDENDNLVHANSIYVEASLVPDVDLQTDQVPNLVGKVKEQVRDGIATFCELKIGDKRAATGVYRLTFTAKNMTLAYLEIFYQNDAEEVAYRARLQQKIVSTNKIMGEVQSRIDKLVTFQKQKLKSLQPLKTLLEQAKSEFITMLDSGGESSTIESVMASPESIRNTVISLETRIADLMKRATPRNAVYPNNQVVEELLGIMSKHGTETSGIVGVVALLAYIDDVTEAELLGRVIASKMAAVVVKNKEYFDKYYEKYKSSSSPFSLVSLTQMLGYKSRNAEDNLNPLLPFRVVEGAPIDGFLGFAVNRIHLKKNHEVLRKTLFFTLLKDIMVFDYIQNGMAYREYCIKRGKGCPTIICISDGETIESSGFVTVGDKRTKSKPFAFGSIPPNEDVTIAREREALNRLNQVKDLLIEIREKETKIEEECKDSKKEIAKLESEIKRLKKEASLAQSELESLEDQSLVTSGKRPNEKPKRKQFLEDEPQDEEEEAEEDDGKHKKKPQSKKKKNL